ncbi:MAG: hypothetical protein IJ196_01590, partial [Prevotella sp.]|nr:hypothetical protein [Prevotella sp.]
MKIPVPGVGHGGCSGEPKGIPAVHLRNMPHTPMMYGAYMCLVLSIPTACTGRYAKRCRREGFGMGMRKVGGVAEKECRRGAEGLGKRV